MDYRMEIARLDHRIKSFTMISRDASVTPSLAQNLRTSVIVLNRLRFEYLQKLPIKEGEIAAILRTEEMIESDFSFIWEEIMGKRQSRRRSMIEEIQAVGNGSDLDGPIDTPLRIAPLN